MRERQDRRSNWVKHGQANMARIKDSGYVKFNPWLHLLTQAYAYV